MTPTLNITHIGTATAILEINGVNMLTDPFFSPAGTKFPVNEVIHLLVDDDPALRLDQLPVIDAVLLSHEDHDDNLDDLGRRLLDGRRVFTTVDGAKNLSPRPAVHGLKPWERINVTIAGKKFEIIGTPTQHLPGGECTGFIITGEGFGTGRDNLPKAIYFSGDTVYIEDLKKMADEYHICAAVFNLGNAHVPSDLEDPNSPLINITMDGKQAARLFRDIKADVLIPMHYESWHHFTQFGKDLRAAFEEEGISDKYKQVQIARILLEAGADPTRLDVTDAEETHAVSREARTAFMTAAYWDAAEVLQLLIDRLLPSNQISPREWEQAYYPGPIRQEILDQALAQAVAYCLWDEHEMMLRAEAVLWEAQIPVIRLLLAR
ncbi:hypothetical protein CNMCM6936_009568 [Aspergillus lentulus]|nr:hypothetical protein CNMCM6936_009568 [Aspergillus lentulus]